MISLHLHSTTHHITNFDLCTKVQFVFHDRCAKLIRDLYSYNILGFGSFSQASVALDHSSLISHAQSAFLFQAHSTEGYGQDNGHSSYTRKGTQKWLALRSCITSWNLSGITPSTHLLDLSFVSFVSGSCLNFWVDWFLMIRQLRCLFFNSGLQGTLNAAGLVS
jgi:hypothetical protein